MASPLREDARVRCRCCRQHYCLRHASDDDKIDDTMMIHVTPLLYALRATYHTRHYASDEHEASSDERGCVAIFDNAHERRVVIGAFLRDAR